MIILPRRFTQQPPGIAVVDPSLGASFAWLASEPTRDISLGIYAAGALGTAAANEQGVYRDLQANTATQSFSVPLPATKYTILTVFVPVSSLAANNFVRCTSNGFRVDIACTVGGVNAYICTNNGIAAGPSLVLAGTFNRSPAVGISTYDGTTIKSWLLWNGAEISGSAVGGYAAPSGTLDFGASIANQGMQMVLMLPSHLPDAHALALLRNPWQVWRQPRRMLFPQIAASVVPSGTLGQFDPELRLAAWF